MKLKSFRVTNYRSIIDSKECYLSPNDGITVLAGQNESGKSSLLEAINFYESGDPRPEAYRDSDDDIKPKVYCTYSKEIDEELYDDMLKLDGLSEEDLVLLRTDVIRVYVEGIEEVKLERVISPSKELSYGVLHTTNEELKLAVTLLKSEEQFKSLTERSLRNILGKLLFRLTPIITFFNEFTDTLPEIFFLDDLNKTEVKGQQAVKNIETILETDFSKLPSYTDTKVDKYERIYRAQLTADFNERWQQRIGNETGATISIDYKQGGTDGRPYLRFLIETHDGDILPPEKRSVGFKWFLSFYLHLRAFYKKRYTMILLFDEPGLYLHSRAQHDMLALFEELSEFNQIIYSTHSPYLIDTTKLNRVRLIFNSKTKGTTVEKITTNITPNQKDAIKPIIDALGLNVAHDFSAAKKRNVIVEGISDYYYLTAAKKLLNIEMEFYFMPAMGSPNAHLLMELCIGWGLEWLMIFDEKGSTKDVGKIKTQFFPNDPSINTKIHVLKGCDGIEDIFEEEDIKLAAPGFIRTAATLSKDLSSHGGKELIGRFFLDKVEAGEITLDKLSEKAQNHFKEIFAFIEQGFK